MPKPAETQRELRAYLRGGLGNQLFQLCSARALAERYERKLILDTTFLPGRADTFRGVSRWPLEIAALVEDAELIDSSRRQPFGGTSGYSKLLSTVDWLSSKVPVVGAGLGVIPRNLPDGDSPQVNQKVLRMISLSIRGHDAEQQLQRLRSRLEGFEAFSEVGSQLIRSANEVRPVLVHYRSGDYENLKHVFGTTRSDYWLRARSLFPAKAQVWVITDADELQEAESVFGFLPDKIVPGQNGMSPMETLLLLTKGSGLIGSNSTFSWWGAALGSRRRRVALPNVLSALSSISNLGSADFNCYWLDA